MAAKFSVISLALLVGLSLTQAIAAEATGRELLSIDESSRHQPEPKGGKGGKGPGCEGDPHFTGADSSHFDFSGVPNTTYCVMSDAHFHVNAYFGGYYGQYESNPSKAITWMRKIGVLWGQHSVLFEAREGPSAEYGNGYMANIEIDGQKVSLPAAGDKTSLIDGRVAISWIAAKEQSGDDLIDVYALDIKGVVSMILELRPEVPNFRTETDGTVHFDIYFPVSYVSDNAHGILGQTYRSDHKDRLSSMKLVYNAHLDRNVVPGDNGDGYLDGKVEDYKTSGMLASDCHFSRFVKAQVLDPETALALEMSSGVPSVLGDSASTVKLTAASSTYRRMMKLKLMKRLRLL